MITLTKLNDKVFVLNSMLIESMEETPDTVIVMRNGNRYVVKDSMNSIIEKIVIYQRKIHGN